MAQIRLPIIAIEGYFMGAACQKVCSVPGRKGCCLRAVAWPAAGCRYCPLRRRTRFWRWRCRTCCACGQWEGGAERHTRSLAGRGQKWTAAQLCMLCAACGLLALHLTCSTPRLPTQRMRACAATLLRTSLPQPAKHSSSLAKLGAADASWPKV